VLSKRSPLHGGVLGEWRYSIAQWYSARLRTLLSGARVPSEVGNFLFSTVSRPALGPTQPPIQCVPGDLSLGVKRPRRETDHSPPSSAKVKSVWSYTSTPPLHLQGVVLIWSYLYANKCSNEIQEGANEVYQGYSAAAIITRTKLCINGNYESFLAYGRNVWYIYSKQMFSYISSSSLITYEQEINLEYIINVTTVILLIRECPCYVPKSTTVSMIWPVGKCLITHPVSNIVRTVFTSAEDW
jgi:hypothetical protein